MSFLGLKKVEEYGVQHGHFHDEVPTHCYVISSCDLDSGLIKGQ